MTAFIIKQYSDLVCILMWKRKTLKEQLKQTNDIEKRKRLEIRIRFLTEEIYEVKEISEFLINRYGGVKNAT